MVCWGARLADLVCMRRDLRTQKHGYWVRKRECLGVGPTCFWAKRVKDVVMRNGWPFVANSVPATTACCRGNREPVGLSGHFLDFTEAYGELSSMGNEIDRRGRMA